MKKPQTQPASHPPAKEKRKETKPFNVDDHVRWDLPREEVVEIKAFQIIVWVSVSGRTLAVYRDDVKGSNVTVNLALPSSLSLLDLRVKVKAHSKGHGKKRRIYFRTPPTCPPNGQWTTGVEFTFGDGSSQQLSAPTPCRR